MINHVSPASSLKRRRPTRARRHDGVPRRCLPELTNEADGNVAQLREGRVRHKSLKSRPGALKRKEKVVRGEMARFGASMAALAATPEAAAAAAENQTMTVEDTADTPAAPAPATTNRWAALRRHISTTMEQNPAFTGQGAGKG
ncbi:predicted protein [Verticillium alfalfae VaMs.102]|uniref:Ribosome biogenesis protein SLX9 n=1 Tax=Verticillium alfalfae (strain VaMs.102 / ATCC MYA-4576 / FGSC 10136) TaxID=526221 RepID=C9SJ29_VERA1|nr:predicted protein [Verticillium alfalfae VaMs.102]EEY18952.1 predicted protein [Verticillium alfalfae VaMs.102]